jgi:hypothetical protein
MKNKKFSFADDNNEELMQSSEGDNDGAFLQRLLEETLDHQVASGSRRDPFQFEKKSKTPNDFPDTQELSLRLTYLRSRRSFYFEYLDKNLEVPENFSFFKIYQSSSFKKSIVNNHGEHQLFFQVLARYFGLGTIIEMILPDLKSKDQYSADLIMKATLKNDFYQDVA